MTEQTSGIPTNNLVIGLAGPYGAGCSSVAGDLVKIFREYPGCVAEKFHVASMIRGVYEELFGKKLDLPSEGPERRRLLQKAGTALRLIDPDFVGSMIGYLIADRGEELEKAGRAPLQVFIVDSLKNEHDYLVLRRIFGSEFSFVFVTADPDSRWHRQREHKQWPNERAAFDERDQVDSDESSLAPEVGSAGQQVRRLAWLADYHIVNHGNRETLTRRAARFVDLLMGDSKNQPTLDERSMHLAYSASNRSFCLSRQVGAALLDGRGNVIGLGHNDVPRVGGGLYSQEDGEKDSRCYLIGDRKCRNDTEKERRFSQLDDCIGKTLNLDASAKAATKKAVRGSTFRDATEFCRAIHAEMEAILSAARTGAASTVNGTLYVTTQPCHNCAKHIVGAGIRRVVYIEPYPKSLADLLHSDAVRLGAGRVLADGEMVVFAPYEGVAPARYHDFFALIGKRKGDDSSYVYRPKEEQIASPRFANWVEKRTRIVEKDSPLDNTTSRELQNKARLNEMITRAEANLAEVGTKAGANV